LEKIATLDDVRKSMKVQDESTIAKLLFLEQKVVPHRPPPKKTKNVIQS